MPRETLVLKKRPTGEIDFIPKGQIPEWQAKYAASSKSFKFRAKKVERGTWVWRDGKMVPKWQAQALPSKGRGLQVIRDLEPYRAIGVDNRIVGGRRQHREMLRENKLIEVGDQARTELPPPPPDRVDMGIVNELKRAMGKL